MRMLKKSLSVWDQIYLRVGRNADDDGSAAAHGVVVLLLSLRAGPDSRRPPITLH